jgi:hypothetical protein
MDGTPGRIFGQDGEAVIGVNILNRMTELGMPESHAVRS